jgi:hypothetical protein
MQDLWQIRAPAAPLHRMLRRGSGIESGYKKGQRVCGYCGPDGTRPWAGSPMRLRPFLADSRALGPWRWPKPRAWLASDALGLLFAAVHPALGPSSAPAPSKAPRLTLLPVGSLTNLLLRDPSVSGSKSRTLYVLRLDGSPTRSVAPRRTPAPELARQDIVDSGSSRLERSGAEPGAGDGTVGELRLRPLVYPIFRRSSV